MLHLRAAVGLGKETLSGDKGTDIIINTSKDVYKFILLEITPFISIFSLILHTRFQYWMKGMTICNIGVIKLTLWSCKY